MPHLSKNHPAYPVAIELRQRERHIDILRQQVAARTRLAVATGIFGFLVGIVFIVIISMPPVMWEL